MTVSAYAHHKRTEGHTEKQLFNYTFALFTFGALALFGVSTLDPNDFRWLPIIGLAALCLLQMSAGAFMREKIMLDKIELALLAFIFYTVLSLAWSPDPLAGMALISKLGLLATIFLCIKNAGNDNWFKMICIAIGLSVASVLGLVFMGIGGPAWQGGYGNQNFLTEFLILAIPFIAVLTVTFAHRAIKIAAFLLIVTDLAYLFFINPSKIEFLVFSGLSIAMVIGWGWRRSKWLALGGLLVIITLTCLAVATLWNFDNGFRESIFPRLALLTNSLLMWRDQPLYGLGAGSFNYLYPIFQERHFEWLDVGSELLINKHTAAGASHNEYAQFLATFGLIGATLAGAFGYYVLANIKKHHMTPYVWTGLWATATWMLNALVEFPLQNPATGLLAAIALGLLAHQHPGAEDANKSIFAIKLHRVSGIFLLMGTIGLISLTSYGGYRFSSANELYQEAISQLNVNPERSYRTNLEAYQAYPWETSIRSQLYVTTTRWAELSGKTALHPEELDRAFMVSLSAGPNTLLLLARLQYLMNTRLMIKDPQYAAEAKQWIGMIRNNATHTPDALIVDTYYSVLTQDYRAGRRALARADKLPLNDQQKQTLDMLRKELEKRSAPRSASVAKTSAAAK